MSEDKYINEAQQRLMKLILVLAGNELYGLAPIELATAVKAGKSTITRDLANLKKGGFAERIEETDRWRLGPKPVQIGLAYSSGMARTESRIAETKNRYTREP